MNSEKIKEVKLPCVTQNCLLTVASFRTWRGWAMLCCAGLDPKDTKNTPTSLYIFHSTAGFLKKSFRIIALSRLQVRGADQDRTDDLFVANEALSQLSYSPIDDVKLHNNF
jgi:hypothetical protein